MVKIVEPWHPDHDTPWHEVAKHVDEQIESMEGFVCCACHRYGQKYSRSLGAGCALFITKMLDLVESGEESPYIDGEWVQVSRLINTPGGEYGKLKMWGLIKPSKKKRGDGSRRSGWWKLTKKGKAWARGEIAVPKFAYVYDDEVDEIEGPDWTLRDAFGENFDYEEFMSRRKWGTQQEPPLTKE